MNRMYRKTIAAMLLTGCCSVAGTAAAQVAGSTPVGMAVQESPLGVSVEEMRIVAVGWSAKKSILGHDVYNDAGAKVGKIDDLIIAPDSSVSYAIVGAGGFVGVGRHNVAIPVKQFKLAAGKLTLPGASKDAIKALPEFEYAK